MNTPEEKYYVVCEPSNGTPYVLHVDARSLRDAQCSVAWQQRSGYEKLTHRICEPDPNATLVMRDIESDWSAPIRHPLDGVSNRTFTAHAVETFFKSSGWASQ